MKTVEKIKEIASEWEKRTNLNLEWDVFEHGKLVQKDVNNYLLIDKSDGHYKWINERIQWRFCFKCN